MNEKELNRLLLKYYSGESTEQEEFVLREYFMQGEIPKGYGAEKEIFGYFDLMHKIPDPGTDFEYRILSSVKSENTFQRTKSLRKFLIPVSSAAAGIIIFIASYFFLTSRSETIDTYTDPKIAYAETIKILLNVSSQLNHGTSALEPVGKINEMKTKSFKVINKSGVVIMKNLKQLSYLTDTKGNTNGNDSIANK